jgi:hypothetical protein
VSCAAQNINVLVLVHILEVDSGVKCRGGTKLVLVDRWCYEGVALY